MSVTVSRQFAADFELWADALRAEGDTDEGVDEIRQAIRDALAAGGEAAAYWQQRVSNEAAVLRGAAAPMGHTTEGSL